MLPVLLGPLFQLFSYEIAQSPFINESRNLFTSLLLSVNLDIGFKVLSECSCWSVDESFRRDAYEIDSDAGSRV